MLLSVLKPKWHCPNPFNDRTDLRVAGGGTVRRRQVAVWTMGRRHGAVVRHVRMWIAVVRRIRVAGGGGWYAWRLRVTCVSGRIIRVSLDWIGRRLPPNALH